MKAFLNRTSTGFTLVEMLVSMAILAIILAILAQVTGALQVSVTQTTSGVHEFEAARDAFEVMTRRIGQATLNSYNDQEANTGLGVTVAGYTRASELRFISGPASLSSASLAGTTGPLFGTVTSPYHPSHAIFFQAPLGKLSTSALNNTATPTISTLAQVMNTVGYFIEWNNDSSISGGLNIVPSFISGYVPRWRYRLMEMIEPSDSLAIYSHTSGPNSSSTASASWTYFGKEWFQTPYQNSSSSSSIDYQCARPIADNIICVAFLPMVAPQNAQYPQGGATDGTSTDLMVSPSGQAGYLYDTAPAQGSGTPPISQNQLPPMVYVMMIAVDEISFSRYQAIRGTSAMANVPTNLGIDAPGANQNFLTVSTYAARQDPSTGDISTVVAALNTNHIRYRIFSTTVTLTTH